VESGPPTRTCVNRGIARVSAGIGEEAHVTEFEGKKILIAGAGREFGRTLAVGFARSGAELFLSARTLEEARATETVIKSISAAAIVHLGISPQRV
jgi:NADP-dependent 3-hydroxy acid dehydrogenase YdfG